MRIATFVATIVALGGVRNPAYAQQTGQGQAEPVYMTSHALAMAVGADPLSLEDAVRHALTHNADIAASRQQIEPLRSKTQLSRVLPPPTLEAQIWQWPVNSVDPRNTDSFMLMASQDLPGKGKRAAAETVAQSE